MNLAEFHFMRPYWFLALIPAISIIVFLLRNKLNQGNWSSICDAELLPFVLEEKRLNRSHWVLSATALASLLVIIALAGPTWQRLPTPVFRNDAALVIALDLSQSMDASDIKPSRLHLARYKVIDILKQRKDGQTALIVYAGSAFTVTPLTEDTETIASQISALTTEIMPSQGSNTLSAIEKSVALLKQSGLPAGDILLITDGVDLEHISDMSALLKGYRLSVLGVGTTEGSPIKLASGGFLKDRKGNIVVPKLNHKNLSQLAAVTQGIYQQMSSDNSDINGLLSQFDSSVAKEEQVNDNLLIEQWHEQGPWLLLFVLPLVALSFRKGLLSLALFCLLPFPQPSYALEWDGLWTTQNQQAQQAFEQKNYPKAAEQFENTEWQAAAHYKAEQYQQAAELLKEQTSADGLYNLGNALAKSGQLAEAKTAYEKSLVIDPTSADAQYNKEQVEKQLEQQQQQQQQQQGDNKDSEKKDDKQQGNKEGEQGDQSKPSDQQDQSEQNKESRSDNLKPAEANDESEQQPDKASQPEQQEQQQQENADDKPAEQAADSSDYDESEQASEQWLNSIPDDPAGLLKRKFKYQYGRQGQKNNSNKAW